MKSCASSIVHKSAPIETSNTSLNHNLDKASLNVFKLALDQIIQWKMEP
jgi:hypothetical protein